MQPWLHRFLKTTAIAAIPISSICCFAPLVIFSGNAPEFWTSFPQVIGVYLPYAGALAVALGLAGQLMTDEGLHRYRAMLCALAILLWLQGNILVWDYGVLDGREIEWMSGAWRGVVDMAIWIAVLLAAIYAYQRFGKALLMGAVATLFIQLVAAATTLITNPAILQTTDVVLNTAGRDAVMRFSATSNIVHIVMDGFQSDIFAEIIADTSGRNFKAGLQGFTYFEDNLGAYPYTQLTVPAMLSGKLFGNDVPVDEFISDVMRGNTIINTAFAAGYEVDIAAPISLANVYNQGRYSNAYGISSSGHVDLADYLRVDAARLIDLALFRVVPHVGKALVYRDALWVFQASAQAEAYLQMQYFSDLAFLEELAQGMSVDRDVPVYKMIHVMLSHRPFVGNEQCEFSGRKSGSRENVRAHARCGLIRVLDVLQRMKDLGIYDSSLIVLMADHGAWVPVENLAASDVVKPLTVAMATPMLAVKPPGANNDFQSSSAPSSVIDIPATIADIADIDSQFDGMSVFSISVDEPRQRLHRIYGYGINPDASGYLFPMQEYMIDGSPYDSQAWHIGRRYLPGGNSR